MDVCMNVGGGVNDDVMAAEFKDVCVNVGGEVDNTIAAVGM